MSSPSASTAPRPELADSGPAEKRARWIELATSPDHKLIGMVLIAASLGALFLATFEMLLVQLQLSVPDNSFLTAITFDRLFTLYGTTGIFLVALPLLVGLLLYVVPLQIGSRQTALPRLSQTGLWLWIAGGLTLYASLLYTPPEAGINPLPTLSESFWTANNGMEVWITATGLAVLGMLLISIDLLVTVTRLRAPGMNWRRAPFFTWAAAVVSSLLVVVSPVFLATVAMLLLDRRYGSGFFLGSAGGSPILWQHLTYIFFTGVAMACAVGFLAAIAEVVQTFTGRLPVGRRSIHLSMVALALVGTLAWTQNMLTVPIPSGWKYYGMLMALALIIPFGLILYNLVATISAGGITVKTPVRFALGALSLISVGLVAKIGQSTIGISTLFADTVDTWAATQFVLVGLVAFGGLAAVSYWFPKMTGRLVDESRSRIAFWVMYAGLLAALLPQYVLGTSGDRIAGSYRVPAEEGLGAWNMLATLGTIAFFIGLVLALSALIRSRNEGEVATPDPWQGDSLEWLTLSPPAAHNFDVLPGVRSSQPMRDIRDAAPRSAGQRPSGESQPVA